MKKVPFLTLNLTIAAILAIIFSACDMNPLAPTTGEPPVWYPCVGVQTPGNSSSPEFQIQMAAIRELKNAGRAKWMRLGDVSITGNGLDYAIGAKSEGLGVFAILDIEDLDASQSWEDTFDQMKVMFPQVDIWEIGGEISNRAINPRIITPEEYMGKFKALSSHVLQTHPGVILTSAPTEGNAKGPQEFLRFIELGLLDMDPSVIIALNVYDFGDKGHALQEYANIFSLNHDKLKNRRIWITETGGQYFDKQLQYYETRYQEIGRILHPEMMCWYILWAGDGAGDSGFSLINNVTRPPLIKSNLFKKLTGGLQ